MNGSAFIASSAWPLLDKMSHTNFPAAPVARLEELPDTDIAWFNPGRHPAQGIIARSSTTEQALAGGGRETTTALSVAGASTADALSSTDLATTGAVSSAGGSTGGAVLKSYRKTRHALGTSASHVGRALRITPRTPAPVPQ